jgi:hypothetical protein
LNGYEALQESVFLPQRREGSMKTQENVRGKDFGWLNGSEALQESVFLPQRREGNAKTQGNEV